MLYYAANRVRPDAGHVGFRGRVADTEAWAQHSEWSHLSQGQRALQWITSRPTRPATMHVVRAAFAQAR